MVQYMVECMAFQLVFLIIYDLFLKKETFFQWNRVYLLGTYVLSLLLPWIKIETLTYAMPSKFKGYPDFLWQSVPQEAWIGAGNSAEVNFDWGLAVFGLGGIVALGWFLLKLYRLWELAKQGHGVRYKDFTQILVKDSTVAFSFLKTVFVGDKISEREYPLIISHELVHVRQWHTLDLLLFEVLRILNWFNPLVYVFQNRIAELHEFIADAEVPKTERTAHYELLLSQAFGVQNISFVNQFFKSSLIKKRIVMLQKAKSKNIWQLKYMLLVPIVLGMLCYTSCESDIVDNDVIHETQLVADLENLTEEEEIRMMNRVIDLSVQPKDWQYIVQDGRSTVTFSQAPEGSGISGPGGTLIKAKMHIESSVLPQDIDLLHSKEPLQIVVNKEIGVPFALVEEVPIFPGCENATDKRACFNEKMLAHISKNFNYPQKAQELGISGRVSAIFTINAQGDIINISQRGPHKLLEDEVHRIMSILPKMTPGKNKGLAVSVPYSIPISFRLEQGGFNPVANKGDYAGSQKQQVVNMPKAAKLSYANAVTFGEVDKVPIFPGCENTEDPRACFAAGIQQHIMKNFNYPRNAQEKGIQGTVNCMFLIDEHGNITNIAKRGPDPVLEQEAERIIALLPKMKPGINNGKKVAVPYSMPITFKLN